MTGKVLPFEHAKGCVWCAFTGEGNELLDRIDAVLRADAQLSDIAQILGDASAYTTRVTDAIAAAPESVGLAEKHRVVTCLVVPVHNAATRLLRRLAELEP